MKTSLRRYRLPAVVTAVIIIPLLYSFFYLNAFWDPYSRLQDLPVAFVNSDKGGEVAGKAKNIGQEVADKVTGDATLKWSLVSHQEAEQGLVDGKYYASIEVPEDFTARIAKADSADRTEGVIVYRPYEKRNFLAAQVMNRVVVELKSKVAGEIDAALITTLRENLLSTPEGLTKLADGIATAKDGSKSLADGSTELRNGAQTLTDSIGKLAAGGSAAANGAFQLQGGAAKIEAGAGQLAQGLSGGATQLDGLQKQLAGAAAKGVSIPPQAAAQMAEGIKKMEDALNQAASQTQALAGGATQLRSGAGSLGNSLNTLSGGANALAEGSKKLTDGAGKLADGSKQLNDGLNTLESKTREAAGTATGETKKLDGLEKFVAEPIRVDTQAKNPVPDYGSAFAPYFISLSLWVGALLMFYAIYLDPNIRAPRVLKSNRKARRFAGYAVLGVLQAAALVIALTAGLGLKPVSMPAFWGACLAVSITFIVIMQFLIVYLEEIGKFTAIVLLILQLTSCGGTFPMELVPDFFKVIGPWMPMTYSVDLLREVISGMDNGTVMMNLGYLGIFVVVFTALSGLMNLRGRTQEPLSEASDDEFDGEIAAQN